MKDKVDQIVAWLQAQVKAANVNGLIVGVSGGLDSAVVAGLIKRAFPEDSLGVIMPLKSNPQDIIDAQEVVDTFDIKSMTVELSESHAGLYGDIKQQIETKKEWKVSQNRIADANLRARLRMSTLYTIATNYNYLVVGTDNASEWYTGYFTKYGDGGVDLLPIVDLTKAEVFEMAAYLNAPHAVIDKKPSADLWEGQTDEEEMGTSYDKIDAHVKGQAIPEADRIKIEQMHQRTAHKRSIPKQLKLG